MESLLASRSVFREQDDDRLVRRLEEVAGADVSRAEIDKLANGDFTPLGDLSVPAQQGVLALVRADDPMLGALEQMVGASLDYVGVAFLDRARRASRPVARIISLGHEAIGTGVMISPRLLLTNNHVTPNRAAASAQLVQFNYELDMNDVPCATTQFRLQPDLFFVTSPSNELDFTVVAVGDRVAGDAPLADFGYVTISRSGGKHAEGDFVTIVQHPEGIYKQIALRDNRVLGRGAKGITLYYGADTLGGASGSPVFNDQFQLVALHHAGGPRNDHTLDTGEPAPDDSNEGIRISVIIERLEQEAGGLDPDARALLTGALNGVPSALDGISAFGAVSAEREPATTWSSADGVISVVVPVQISVRLGGQTPAVTRASGATSAPASSVSGRDQFLLERNGTPDQRYSARRGYNEQFLGRHIALPQLSPQQLRSVAKLKNGTYELKYLHYSAVQNAKRKLPFFTAVNIDGKRAPQSVNRDTGVITWPELEATEKWYPDPRIEMKLQTTDEYYLKQQEFRMFDRGHLVRRLDPAWGSEDLIRRAVDDTFHSTNCAPQQHEFNQRKRFWAGIEDYVLNTARAQRDRVTVFSGPIFTSDDPDFWGVKVPRSFWKIVVRVDDGVLKATGFIASQDDFLEAAAARLEAATIDWDQLGPAREYQARIELIADKTGLDFGGLEECDTFGTGEPERLHALEAIRW